MCAAGEWANSHGGMTGLNVPHVGSTYGLPVAPVSFNTFCITDGLWSFLNVGKVSSMVMGSGPSLSL
jgi:hypothetical protein